MKKQIPSIGIIRNVAILVVFAVAGCKKAQDDVGHPDAPVPQAQFDKLAASQKTAEELCYQVRYSDDPKKIEEMLESGSDISGHDQNGFTPLVMAVMSGSGGSDEVQAKIVDLLLDHGANPSLECPLYYAAVNREMSLVKKLLDRGADVNGKIANGCTPLMAAVDAQCIEIVTLLLDRGANADLKEERGKNAWKLAFDKAYAFNTLPTMKVEELLRGRTNRADIEGLLRADTSLKESFDVEKWLQINP